MADETTMTTATELIRTEVINLVILDALYATMAVAPLIRNEECPGDTNTMQFPVWNDVSGSVATPGEATDLANTALNPTAQTITPTEKGIMTTVTDMLVKSSPASLEGIGRELGRALGVKIDVDICALFAALNGASAVGTTNTALTASVLLDAIYQLELDDVPAPFHCVLHPLQKEDLMIDLTSSGASPIWGGDLGNKIVSRGALDGMFGIDRFVTSTNVPTANTAADRCGALFNPEAMAIVWKWRTKSETERNASLRATEVVVTACYGVGEISDARGVPIISDVD